MENEKIYCVCIVTGILSIRCSEFDYDSTGKNFEFYKEKELVAAIPREQVEFIILKEATAESGMFPSKHEKTAGWADYVKSIATADVAPLVHGKWDIHDWGYIEPKYIAKCSCCGYSVNITDYSEKSGVDFSGTWKFCPNCGAKMDGENDDN